jgi:hypothetical protein
MGTRSAFQSGVAGLDDKVSANGFQHISRVGEVRLIGSLGSLGDFLPRRRRPGVFEERFIKSSSARDSGATLDRADHLDAMSHAGCIDEAHFTVI